MCAIKILFRLWYFRFVYIFEKLNVCYVYITFKANQSISLSIKRTLKRIKHIPLGSKVIRNWGSGTGVGFWTEYWTILKLYLSNSTWWSGLVAILLPETWLPLSQSSQGTVRIPHSSLLHVDGRGSYIFGRGLRHDEVHHRTQTCIVWDIFLNVRLYISRTN